MQRNRMIPCVRCGALFKQGFGHINHAFLCRVEPPLVPYANAWEDIHGPEGT